MKTLLTFLILFLPLVAWADGHSYGTLEHTGTFTTTAGTPVLFGKVRQIWTGMDTAVGIEAFGNRHGLVVHTSATQGAGIVSYSQSGAAAIKAYQDSHANSSALWVGRPLDGGLNPITTGTAPLITGRQSASFTGSLLLLVGLGEFEVKNDGSVRVGSGTVPSTSTDAGLPGQMAWDASYFYLCTGTNIWTRTRLSSW